LVTVPFFDLKAGYTDRKADLDRALIKVLESGFWIGGPEVAAFEKAWASYCQAPYAVGVGNGTDAITLALWACGISPGDEVLLPALSAYPSAVGVLRSGAVPVFVDVNAEDGLFDVAGAEASITQRTRAILPVHLYGNPCDMDGVSALAKKYSLKVVEDCAQAHGTLWKGRAVGTFSQAAAWSFYPTKNLGAAGDAGAVTTDSPDRSAHLARLRNYGQKDRYEHVEAGVNSRLDPIQALFLSEKLKDLPKKTERRREIGARYDAALLGIKFLRNIQQKEGSQGNRHLYPVFLADPSKREIFRNALLSQGVETLVHYPVIMPDQPATAPASRKGNFGRAKALASSEVSLPIYPELRDDQVSQVLRALEMAAQ
jgi:dTDP-4-amino-4,6-dideoxygalactose transaminase